MFRSLLDREDLPMNRLSTDTTFQVSPDVYVTIVTYRQTEFEENPIMALAYLFHGRKFEEDHRTLINWVLKAIPELRVAKRCISITDNERGIVNAVQELGIPHFLSSNHGWGDMKRHLRSLGISIKPDLASYKESVYDLLASDSEKDYTNKLLAVQSTDSKLK